MDVRILTTGEDLRTYDQWMRMHPDGSLWQSPEWKRYQEALGREARIYGGFEDGAIVASALVIIDKTTFGFSTWDIPRGPLGTIDDRQWMMDFLKHIAKEAMNDRCLSLFFSPQESWSILHLPSTTLPSPRHEQPEATRILDLTLTDEELLKQMHQKGRYNIGVAKRHGLRIERSTDANAFSLLAKETAGRDGFTALSSRHYRAFLDKLPGSFLLLAFSNGNDKPLAGLIGAIWNDTGIYYYGASDYVLRALMAPYLLQWEAMKICREASCLRYDLLGIAPPDAPKDHPWAGVTTFKEKFGGTVVTYPPEQEIRIRPVASAMLRLKRRFF